jgi:hypothetical protein
MQGFVEISRIEDARGKQVPFLIAEKRGWIKPGNVPLGWHSRAYPIGQNLVVDGGRQLLAYLFGGRSPMSNYSCSSFAIGTGTTPAAVTDTALGSPIAFSAGVYSKGIDAISFISPFEARAEFTIAANQANGYLITEFGLLSGNGALFARIVNSGINKTSDWAPALTWTLRF